MVGRLRAHPKELLDSFVYSNIVNTAPSKNEYLRIQRRSNWDQALKETKEEGVVRKHEMEQQKKAFPGVDQWDEAVEEGQVFARDRIEATEERQNLPGLGADSESGFESDEGQEGEELPGEGHEHPWNYGQFEYGKEHGWSSPPKQTPFRLSNITPEDVMRYAAKPGAERPPVPVTTAPVGRYNPTPNHKSPASLWSGDVRREKALRRPWTAKKLGTMELNIAKFVLNLFLMLGIHDMPPSNLMVVPDSIREYAKLSKVGQQTLFEDLEYEIAILHRAQASEWPDRPVLSVNIPTYRMSSDGSHLDIVRDLNDSLLSLRRAFTRKEIGFKELIIKMCGNLVLSPAPPDVQTTNIMLLSFYKLDGSGKKQNTDIGGRIVDHWITLLKSVMVRPNELTCAIILASYRQRGLADDFALFVALMRGKHGGLMVAHPGVKITNASQGRLTTKERRPEKIVQAVEPSVLVYWEVIKGVLKFSGIKHAIAICYNFNQNAWGLSWSCLWELLLACLHAKDWEHGLIVWAQVEALSRKSERPERFLGVMLALCVQCGQKEVFFDIVNSAATGQEKYVPQYVEHGLALVGGESWRRIKLDEAYLEDQQQEPTWKKRRWRQFKPDPQGNALSLSSSDEELISPLDMEAENMSFDPNWIAKTSELEDPTADSHEQEDPTDDSHEQDQFWDSASVSDMKDTSAQSIDSGSEPEVAKSSTKTAQGEIIAANEADGEQPGLWDDSPFSSLEEDSALLSESTHPQSQKQASSVQSAQNSGRSIEIPFKGKDAVASPTQKLEMQRETPVRKVWRNFDPTKPNHGIDDK